MRAALVPLLYRHLPPRGTPPNQPVETTFLIPMQELLHLEPHAIGQHQGKHIGTSDWETLLNISDWSIKRGEHWAVVGGSDGQRSALCETLRERLDKSRLEFAEVSPAAQETCIAEEIKRAQTGIADEINTGTQVKDFLGLGNQAAGKTARIDSLIETLEFSHCLNKHFRDLSSGETRKALLIRALENPQAFYLLQDPYEGLDKETLPLAKTLVEQALSNPGNDKLNQSCSSCFIASRLEQLPQTITHIAYIDELELKQLEVENLADTIASLAPIISPTPSIVVPDLPKDHPYHKSKPLDPKKPLVSMHDVTVSYADQDKPIFENIDFEIHPFQHCHITGRNGAGKSTLLKLITGDHPQVYNNDIQVCGFRRGAGESVWEVKRHIGYMGGEMLWNYRSSGQLAGKTLNVVISGLHDSIGLYTTANTADKACAKAWLDVFEMGDAANKRFNKLSMAEQRLALIARALIKRPDLLILDEPCQGLDSTDRRRVLSVVEKLITAKACTVLYVSHHDDEKISGIHSQFSLS